MGSGLGCETGDAISASAGLTVSPGTGLAAPSEDAGSAGVGVFMSGTVVDVAGPETPVTGVSFAVVGGTAVGPAGS